MPEKDAFLAWMKNPNDPTAIIGIKQIFTKGYQKYREKLGEKADAGSIGKALEDEYTAILGNITELAAMDKVMIYDALRGLDKQIRAAAEHGGAAKEAAQTESLAVVGVNALIKALFNTTPVPKEHETLNRSLDEIIQQGKKAEEEHKRVKGSLNEKSRELVQQQQTLPEGQKQNLQAEIKNLREQLDTLKDQMNAVQHAQTIRDSLRISSDSPSSVRALNEAVEALQEQLSEVKAFYKKEDELPRDSVIDRESTVSTFNIEAPQKPTFFQGLLQSIRSMFSSQPNGYPLASKKEGFLTRMWNNIKNALSGSKSADVVRDSVAEPYDSKKVDPAIPIAVAAPIPPTGDQLIQIFKKRKEVIDLLEQPNEIQDTTIQELQMQLRTVDEELGAYNNHHEFHAALNEHHAMLKDKCPDRYASYFFKREQLSHSEIDNNNVDKPNDLSPN